MRHLAVIIAGVAAFLPGCYENNAPNPGPGPAAKASPTQTGPLAGLEITLEPAGADRGVLPRALRLVVKNPSGQPARFVAPGPFCAAATAGDRKIRYPILGAEFRDSEGREGDTNFGPLHADLTATSPPAPEEVMLAPGQSWSRDYPTATFHFFGPCGPAADIEQLFLPGEVQLDMALELIEFLGPPTPTPVRRRTNSITVRVKEAPAIFRRYTEEYQAEALSMLDRIPDAGPFGQGELGSVSEIMAGFDGPDFEQHMIAGRMLLTLGPKAKEAVPRMMKILESSKQYGDRVLAARVLGAIGPPASPAIPDLTAALRDAHGHVRQEAAAALARIQGKPEPEAIDPASGEPVMWGQALSYWIKKMRMGDRGPNDRDFEETGRAHRALEQLGVKAVPRLLESLKGDHETRFPAIMLLRKIADPAGLELIAAALKIDDARVRSGAAEALAPSMFNPSAPGDRDNREFGENVVHALAGALGDSDAEVRWQAARALNRSEAGEAQEALIAALARDPDERVRASAAGALGASKARSGAAMDALRAGAREGPFSVRKAAEVALRALGEAAPLVSDEMAALRERVEKEGGAEEKTARYSEIARAPDGAGLVIFVLAIGGSNFGAFPRTQELVNRMIKASPGETRIGVVCYDGRVVRYPPEGKPAQGEGSKAGAIEFVRSTKLGHGSCIHLGFEAAFDILDAAAAEKAVIVYVGNGAPSCPGKDPETYQKESLEEIARRNHGRAAIHAFAGGEGINASFLKLLAGMNGGTFTRLSP